MHDRVPAGVHELVARSTLENQLKLYNGACLRGWLHGCMSVILTGPLLRVVIQYQKFRAQLVPEILF